MADLALEVGKTYRTFNGLIVFITHDIFYKESGQRLFLGSNKRQYHQNGFQVDNRFPTDFAALDHIKKQLEVQDTVIVEEELVNPLMYLNSLPMFKHAVDQVCDDLQQGGHCGEDTSDKINRQRWNAAVERVCNRLLGITKDT